jgi:hypothetical protein
MRTLGQTNRSRMYCIGPHSHDCRRRKLQSSLCSPPRSRLSPPGAASIPVLTALGVTDRKPHPTVSWSRVGRRLRARECGVRASSASGLSRHVSQSLIVRGGIARGGIAGERPVKARLSVGDRAVLCSARGYGPERGRGHMGVGNHLQRLRRVDCQLAVGWRLGGRWVWVWVWVWV